jgi:hypothetical protein
MYCILIYGIVHVHPFAATNTKSQIPDQNPKAPRLGKFEFGIAYLAKSIHDCLAIYISP